MTEQPAGEGSETCLEPELIAGYLDGEVDVSGRRRVESHLAVCDRCREILTESDRFQVASEDDEAIAADNARSIGPIATVVGALALASIIVLAVRVVRPDLIRRWLGGPNAPRPELVELVSAVGTSRPVEPRMTGGFAYGAVRAPVRSGARRAAPPDTRIAAAKLEKEALADESPGNLAALGVAHLVMREAEQAVLTLEEATSLAPANAEALSDLAAAYLFRAESEDRPEDLPRALACAERALKQNDRLLEARFNRALALERLFLTGEARKAWEDYVARDSRSPWADEARGHLDVLKRVVPTSRLWDERRPELRTAALLGDRALVIETARRFAQPVREYLEEEILPAWGDAVLSQRHDDARRELAVARIVADGLAETTGDRLSSAAVAAIDEAVSQGNQQRIIWLGRGHRAFREGRRLYEGDQPTSSRSAFEDSRRAFERGASPFVEWARLNEAICAYHRTEFAKATADLERLMVVGKAHGYLALEGRAHWIRGLINAVSGRYSEWLADDRTALARFEQIGDRENIAFMRLGLAGSFEDLGESAQAWRFQRLALGGLPGVINPWRRQAILVSGALSCLLEGLPEAALPFQNAVLDAAMVWQRPAAVTEAYEHRSRIHTELGATQEALSDLANAKTWLKRITDPQFAARFGPEVLLAESEALKDREPTQAAEAATEAIARFRQLGFESRLSEVFLLRGRAHLAAGESTLAESDFLSGIEAFERERRAVGDEQLRISFLDNRWALFDEMIHLQAVDRGQPDAAFNYAERARARALLESTAPASAPVDAALVRAQLRPSTQLLYFVVLDDRVLSWLFSRESQSLTVRMIASSDLDRLVQRFRAGFDRSASSEHQNRIAAALYDELIRPVAGGLADGAELVVVPDGPLHAVPFGALFDRTRSRYLIQDHAVGLAPSATLYLQASARLHSGQSSAGPSALVIGNPRVNARDFPDLPSLAAADTEAHEVAALYDRTRLLSGDDATRARFLEEAGLYDVVHFAGHAIQNEKYPLLSKLLFAPEPGEPTSSILLSYELSGARFRRTRLVVLASCQTAAGAFHRGEGAMTLARPFLAAGVPDVVASLWDLDDRAAREIFRTFHQQIRQGLSVPAALRQAQLELMRSSEAGLSAPSSWAGIVAIGG